MIKVHTSTNEIHEYPEANKWYNDDSGTLDIVRVDIITKVHKILWFTSELTIKNEYYLATYNGGSWDYIEYKKE